MDPEAVVRGRERATAAFVHRASEAVSSRATVTPPREEEDVHAPEIVIDRRTFLKAAGATAGIAAMSPLLAVHGGSAARAQAPADGAFDVAGLASQLDYDQDRIFRFVADEIGYDPYAGALRGPTGTLWSRAGNSVDQALLLASLLDEALVRVRFVIGSVDETTASSLRAASTVSVDEGRDRAAMTLLPPETAAAWSGAGAWRRAPEVDGLFVEARDRIETTVDAITAAIAAAGVSLPSGAPDLPELERAGHVWVQAQSGPGWIDLDPSVPGAQPGIAYGAGAQTVDQLPDDLYHRIAIRVDAETVQGGAPARSEMLRHEVRAADLPGTAITLVHPNPEWLGVGSALSGQQVYQPTLLVGDVVVPGSRMTLGTGGGVDDAFGGESSTEGETIAEWLVVEVSVPGGPGRTAERAVFDRIDPDRRAAGTVDVAELAPVDLVDGGEGLGSVFLPLAGLVSLAVTSHPVPWTSFAGDGAGEADELAVASQVAHAFAYLRDLVRLEAVGDRAAPRYYADEPAVTAFWSVPTAIAPDGRKEMAIALDILHAHHASAPFADADSPSPAGVLAGAVDHAAERMVIEGTLSIVPDPPDRLSFVSVGRLFELAAEQGVDLVVLRPGDEARIPPVSPMASAGVAAALREGLVVVAPAAPIEVDGTARTGWWEIDPATGLARDRLDDGGGAELGEYLAMIHELATWAMCIVSLGAAVGAVAKGATNAAMAWGAVAVGQCIAAGAGGVPHVGGH
jgi:hypothetical protein